MCQQSDDNEMILFVLFLSEFNVKNIATRQKCHPTFDRFIFLFDFVHG
jgi:hypothetical protein